ncbi:succinylglutamate desuccinylase/aspartoacylase family protein [cyanobacterium endosymbiont of Epithemia clementina EcSB]|uniref:succinylglutamate desuccinylase/aspartoacylase family protein n=1 Tax=cyanobacterium endosymbiont of Epithemia clementina EcSB TaxID=3034674 RepID=UPI00247FB907|nr:succinylglutamate desuccinylase/aspartoacylase family protein [cyanobacterium endosymbiont of Epithemia clementina EcSB]WGT66967.1 succinylglutamate desuccinylase/aspartoacylase family protein [cyanobacterium endosymbiont of Epithemia clementina EcSB]
MTENLESEFIEIAGETIAPGECRRLELPIARLPTQTWVSLPITVINGLNSGPKLWLSAAIHGDELNGVEIIRQVVKNVEPQLLHGTLIAVPIVNVFGLIGQSRYLPDRRDLNRSFPGSKSGSLASRLAYLFMKEIVSHSTYGIDLHTASMHRTNLPQIRANLQDSETRRCAQAFGAPLLVHAMTRDGSLRQAATKRGIPILLYEGGEALRFDVEAIRMGVEGIERVMEYLEMYQFSPERMPVISIEVDKSKWIRASRSGIFRLEVGLGEKVLKKQKLGIIADAFGESSIKIRASVNGIVIGYTQNPLVSQGDGIIHLAILN